MCTWRFGFTFLLQQFDTVNWWIWTRINCHLFITSKLTNSVCWSPQSWYVDWKVKRNTLYIKPKNKVIFGCLIKKIKWLWHWQKLDWFANEAKTERCYKKKKKTEEKHQVKIQRKISELFSKLRKNEKNTKIDKFKRTCQLMSSRR